VDLNQVYSAPAIPKLGRRNIKSALITGAIKPQIALKKTNFSFARSFVKPKIEEGLTTESLGPILKKEGDTDKKFSIIESFLGSTNKILVQVQNQLALDHLSRIAAEKLQLEKDKKRISRKKVSDKEKKIEEPKKNIAERIFDRVTAPIKSIFQKLIDFFSIILTGLIVNNAFNWLSKKENREKLKKFFDFVVDHWKEILIILGTAKLLSVLLKVVGAAKALKGLIDLFKKKPPGGGGGIPNICNQMLSCFGDPANVTSLAQNLLKNAIFVQGAKGLVGGASIPPVPVVPPLLGPAGKPLNLPPVAGIPTRKPQPQPQPAFQSQGNPSWIDGIVQGMGNIDTTALTGAGAITAATFSTLWNIFSALASADAKAEGGTIEKPKKKCTSCSMFPHFSTGGTVGKGDRPGTDTVPAMVRGGRRVMLDEGEEVIKTSAAMLFRPLLKDINSNGGREWLKFAEGIKKQESTNTVQAENNTRFSKVLEDYDKVLKEEERRLRKKYNDTMLKNKPTRPGGGGGGGAPAAPTPVTSGGGSSGGGGGAPAPAAAPTPVTSGGGGAPAPAAAPTPVTSGGGGAPATSGGGAAAPTPTSGGGGNNRAMPDASKPGALGDPGNPNSPRIGEQVGNLPPPKPKPTTSSASPESTASPIGLLPFKTKNPSTDNLSSLFSANRKNLESLKPSGPSIKVFNMVETNSAIDLTNKNKVGSVPVSGGDPTPLPNISPINGLFAEAMGGWMTSLGIGKGIG